MGIAGEFEKGDEEIKKVKKRFNLQAAFEDLEKRQKIFNDTKNTIEGMFGAIQNNYDVMTMTLPEDKKDFVKKEVKAVSEKLVVVEKFHEKVAKIELKRIQDFVADLQKRVMKECDNFSEDVKYWAEYKTGIKEFKPWLENAEVRSKEGLGKPQTLDEANAMFATVNDFDKACVKHLNILDNANAAAQKMTTHKEADVEVAGLRERYTAVKAVADEWCKKVDTLVKEWKLLDDTVNDLNSWVAKDHGPESEQQFSLEKMESTLGELKNIFKEKEKLVDNL